MINSVDLSNDYTNGVIDRTDHHAPKVQAVCLSLLDAILWKLKVIVKYRF